MPASTSFCTCGLMCLLTAHHRAVIDVDVYRFAVGPQVMAVDDMSSLRDASGNIALEG